MWKKIGRIVLLAGVSVWLVFAIAWMAGAEPVTRAFLPFHLAGVIPGAILTRWDSIRRFFSRND
ncbi:hypothetical protein HQ535_00645 [bacterium]|nr:hypothetical protein [bacterium]